MPLLVQRPPVPEDRGRRFAILALAQAKSFLYHPIKALSNQNTDLVAASHGSR